MTDLDTFLQKFLMRYQKRLLLQVSVRLIIGCLAIGLFAYKLSQLEVSAYFSMGLPVVIGIAGVFFLCRWISQRWIARNSAPAYLDRTLKLQQRLVTAAEFATDKKQSSLYHLLVEDTTHNLSDVQGHMPRPLDKVAALLAIALFLVWMWPVAFSDLLRIAKQTEDPFPPGQEAPDYSDQREQSNESSSQSQEADSSTGQQSGEQSGGDNQSGGDDFAQNAGSQGSDSNSPNSPQGNQDNSLPPGSSGGEQMANQNGQNTQQQQGKSDPPTSNSRNQSAQQQAQGQSARNTQQRAQAKQQSSSAQSKNQSRQQKSENKSGSAQSKQSSSSGSQSAQLTQAAKGSGKQQSQGSERSSGLSAAQQQSMKAEIKELLKELSDEMESFQKQLAKAPETAHPEAGTSSDPDLYERAMEIERKIQARTLPMTLATDDKESGSKRRASGVGESSEDVLDAAPQMSRENSRLSEESAPVQALERQPIPPVYQGVFDNLEQP